MRFRYAAVKASEVTRPPASARIRPAIDCSVGSKAAVAARSSPTAATSERAPALVIKHRRSMKSTPLQFLNPVYRSVARPRRGQKFNLFLSEFFTGPGGFVTYLNSAMRYLIYR